ncbi:MAG: PCI domain-containing protein [Promethearchaeota archaeon]
MSDPEEIKRIQAAIKDLDLDFMRGLMSEEEYNRKSGKFRDRLEQLGGIPTGLSAARESLASPPYEPVKQALTDPVTAVKKTVQSMRRIAIERIAQEAGVGAIQVTSILNDLLDGRELSGRIDHEAGDFILGTGTGPPPKTIAACPYCKSEMKRIAVKGETVTCEVCREAFIVS